MSGVECIRINDHGFVGSASARKMFLVEYERQGSDDKKDMVVLANDASEVVSILEYPQFRSMGRIVSFIDLGTCIDMERVKRGSSDKPSSVRNNNAKGILIKDPAKPSRFDGIDQE